MTSTENMRAIVLYDYEIAGDDELPLMRGEYVNVLDKLDDSGWWQGKNEAGHTGVFPSNYVQVLDNQSPPARPMRARPPTIKMESSASVKEGPLSPSLARPPPVPLTTRPTSLLTSRGSPSSDASSTSAARPITTPPRPTTLPPVPSRRFNSTISTDPKKPTGGVPIFAPDLPPITSPIKQRPSQELPDLPPARPTRPVPAPAATTSSVLSTEKSHTENDHPSRPSMAKVPKSFMAKQAQGNPVPPLRTESTTPPSGHPSGETTISRPPRPASINTNNNAHQLMTSAERKSHNDSPLSPPPMPKRSMPAPPPFSSRPEGPSHSRQSSSDSSSRHGPPDPLELRLKSLIAQEMDKMREEFDHRLKEERQNYEERLTEIENRMKSMEKELKALVGPK